MTIVSDLVKKTRTLDAQEKQGSLGPKEKICSGNTKTGWSVNFPIWRTCRPTKVCAALCYGAVKGRPITWDKSLLKYLRVYRYFLSAPAEEVAERIYKEYKARGMTFLRWNGVGDLFPEAVKVINILAREHPDMILWVVTRKPEMAAKIDRKAKNVYVMFSLDNDPDSRKRKAAMARRRHPRVYYSFLRQSGEDDTMGARIVFNAHQKKKVLPYDDPKTVCPVDAGRVELAGACEGCRKCFSSEALDGTSHHAGETR